MKTALGDAPIAHRVNAILARMTLSQKVGQMTQAERMTVTPDDVKANHLGSVLSGAGSSPGANRPSDWVEMNDAYWDASMSTDDGRLAIPTLYGVDAIHGNNNVRGATIFPHNIGLGAANDPDLLARIARVTAREVLAAGVEWTFAPTLAVAQDIRWGRTYESYAESPDIGAAYAGPFVGGLQGDLGVDAVVACAKHWVGDGGTTNGIDQGDTEVSEEELGRIHIAPYGAAIGAGALTVMASFNSWNGEKCHGSEYLLTEVLKRRMGFTGFVISDWDGVEYLSDDFEEAVARAANAGVDMFMMSEQWERLLRTLQGLAECGAVPMQRIDDAVRRILTVKCAYGLFDRPRPSERPWSDHPSFGSTTHRDVAREAVRKSLVLLKNQGAILPLQRGTRLLVAGKNAHDRGHQCGGFSVEWQGTSGNDAIEGGTSIWEGIRTVAPNAELSVDGSAADPTVHDVAVVVIGEKPYAEGMGDVRVGSVLRGSSPRAVNAQVMVPYGSTLDLSVLHPEDLRTLETIARAGVPIVTLLVSGRPLVVNRELELSSAFVAAWLPGSEGAGVADVLFGDHDFYGRLSFSWPAQDIHGTESPVPSRFPPGYGLTMR